MNIIIIYCFYISRWDVSIELYFYTTRLSCLIQTRYRFVLFVLVIPLVRSIFYLIILGGTVSYNVLEIKCENKNDRGFISIDRFHPASDETAAIAPFHRWKWKKGDKIWPNKRGWMGGAVQHQRRTTSNNAGLVKDASCCD